MAYNAEILQKAGIDPAKLTTRAAYESALRLLDSKKAELGIDALVAMAASVAGGMWWVAGQHNLAAYWGGGLGFNDTSIILNGSYDDQVGSFAQGRTAFLHQGNWVDPNLKQLGVTFRIGYAPHAFLASIATTPEGHDYMVNKAGMIPAFKSVTLKPTGQLSQELMAANAKVAIMVYSSVCYPTALDRMYSDPFLISLPRIRTTWTSSLRI